jgi:thioredoxin-dependent peroxiredoxin
MKIGNQATDFSLMDIKGEKWKLSEKLGKVVALLFYPGNECIICTKQLCSVRDNWAKYLGTGAEIVGVSSDSEDQHHRFTANHNLPLPLLADTNLEITKTYGSHWLLPIWATRAVVVVDAKGIVRYQNIMFRALRPTDEEVLAAIHMAKYNAVADRRVTAFQ